MRHAAFVCFIAMLALARPVAAQEWVEFSSPEDGFSVPFPTQPKVESSTFTSQFGFKLPQRIYSASSGEQRFSVTVIDYRGIEEQGKARQKDCTAGDERCRGGATIKALTGPAYSGQDIRGAVIFAIFKFTQRDAKITDMSWDWAERVEGVLVQLTNNNKTATSAAISMRDNRLYILEATAPAGFPPLGLFQQSFSYVDLEGKQIRYKDLYSNTYHSVGSYPPPDRETPRRY